MLTDRNIGLGLGLAAFIAALIGVTDCELARRSSNKRCADVCEANGLLTGTTWVSCYCYSPLPPGAKCPKQ